MKEHAMNDDKIYKQMYLHLFNAVTDVLQDHKDQPELAFKMLESAQIDCENMYIMGEEGIERRKMVFCPSFAIYKKNR